MIRSEAGVAKDDLDTTERNEEFLGDQLRLYGRKALSKLNLAGVDGYAFVLGDRDPGIDLCGIHKSGRINRILCGHSPVAAREAEADDQRTGVFQETTPRGTGYVHKVSGNHALSFA